MRSRIGGGKNRQDSVESLTPDAFGSNSPLKDIVVKKLVENLQTGRPEREGPRIQALTW